MVHRVTQAVKTRAVQPSEPVGQIAPILLRFAAPPEDLVERTKIETEALIIAAEVKKVPPVAKPKRARESIKPLSGLDVDALLGRPKKVTISPDNSIPQFKQAIAAAEELSEIEDAAHQIGDVVRSLITDSFADSQYDRVLENIGVMREQLVEMEEPALYNTFVTDLKKRLLSGELGGDRRDMWLRIKDSKLGLIDASQSEVSKVTKDQSDEVCIFERASIFHS